MAGRHRTRLATNHSTPVVNDRLPKVIDRHFVDRDAALADSDSDDVSSIGSDNDEESMLDEINEFFWRMNESQNRHLVFEVIVLALCSLAALIQGDFYTAVEYALPLPFLTYLLFDSPRRHTNPPFTVLGIPYKKVLPYVQTHVSNRRKVAVIEYVSHAHIFPLYAGLYHLALAWAYVFMGKYSKTVNHVCCILMLAFFDHYMTGLIKCVPLKRPDSWWRMTTILILFILARYYISEWITTSIVVVVLARLSLLFRRIFIDLFNSVVADRVTRVHCVYAQASEEELSEGLDGHYPAWEILDRPESAPNRYIPSYYEFPTRPIPPHLLPSHQPRRTWGESLNDTLPRIGRPLGALIVDLFLVNGFLFGLAVLYKITCIARGDCASSLGPIGIRTILEWNKDAWRNLYLIDREVIGFRGMLGDTIRFWTERVIVPASQIVLFTVNGVATVLDFLYEKRHMAQAPGASSTPVANYTYREDAGIYNGRGFVIKDQFGE